MVMCPDQWEEMRHFIACVEVSFEREGVRLTNYVSDLLVHDRQRLARLDPSLPFAFAVRASGTHLITPAERDGVGHRSWEYPGFVADSFACEPVRWWWWDGNKMVALGSFVDASKLLREECEKLGLLY